MASGQRCVIVRHKGARLLRQAASNLDDSPPVPLTHLWDQTLNHPYARNYVGIVCLCPVRSCRLRPREEADEPGIVDQNINRSASERRTSNRVSSGVCCKITQSN